MEGGKAPVSEAKLMFSHEINVLLGELLTVVDATFTDSRQAKAVKDLVKSKIWSTYNACGAVVSYDYDSPVWELYKGDLPVFPPNSVPSTVEQ